MVYVPQFFYKLDESGRLETLAVKVVDDLLLAGSSNALQSTADMMSARYRVGTIVFSPGSFLFSGRRITQYDNHSLAVDAEQKISGINPVPITRVRRRKVEELANVIEMCACRSVTGSVG